jgi:peptide/nickel transport system ATP-binding protein
MTPDPEAVLSVRDLRAELDTPEGVVRAVDGIDLSIVRGRTLALVGESGSGKSITALALMRLLPQPAGRVTSGEVRLAGQDLLRLSERQMRPHRGRRLAMIFQEPQSSLNPVMTVGDQLREALAPEDRQRPAADQRRRLTELLRMVGLADAERRLDEYPHELSGGMKQRAMIAMALAGRPDVLIADEPTTALDVTIQAQILELLKQLQRDTGLAILLITHDLGVVAGMADDVAVMYAGIVVEQAPRAAFFATPRHPYARRLFRSIPSRAKRAGRLEMIAGQVPSLRQAFAGCRFADRCDHAEPRCREQPPPWLAMGATRVRCHLAEALPPPAVTPDADSVTPPVSPASTALLEARGLAVHFPIRRGLWRRTVGFVRAVDGVSLTVPPGRTLALVGESGCGKTTVGKAILQLIRPTAGRVHFEGQELTAMSGEPLRRLRRHMPIVFQDPVSSLNPRLLVGEIIGEGLRIAGLPADERQRRVVRLLDQVGLPADSIRRYPHEFSGGQRQRISIARALATEPRLIICDEPTSALDVSVQAQILNLLRELQDDLGLSFLFITHNMGVVEYLAHEVAVMYLGRIVEQGEVQEVLGASRHPYTQALLSAVPAVNGDRSGRIVLAGDIPSPSRPPAGCHFHPRCPQAGPRCRVEYPEETRASLTHLVRCHLLAGGTEK